MADTGVQTALQRIWAGEKDLAAHLLAMAERQVAEHEVHHVALDLARWSADNIEQINRVAEKHDTKLEPPTLDSEVTGCWSAREEPSLRLLEDLCQTYLLASANSLAWEMLAQVAQATQQLEVLDLTSRCHPQTLRQLRWANTMIKTAAPQALSSL
jgi:hypothetical protein